MGRAGKEIATVGTGSAWPSEFSFNLIDRAKIAVVRDACEHRRVCGGNRQCPLSEHYSKLLGMVGPDESMLFAKIQDLRQCSTDIKVNAFMPGQKYIFLATLQQQSP